MCSLQNPVGGFGVSHRLTVPYDTQGPGCLLQQGRAREIVDVELRFCGHSRETALHGRIGECSNGYLRDSDDGVSYMVAVTRLVAWNDRLDAV